MARRLSLRDQIIASAQATMAKGAEHVATLAEIDAKAKQHAERKAGQSDQTDRSDSLVGQTDRTDRLVRLTRQTVEPDRPIGQTDRADRPDCPIDQTNQTVRPDSPNASLVKLPPRSPMVTTAQKAVLRYFQINGSHVTTYELIADETRVPRGTVRAVIRKMEFLGMLRKEDWWKGNIRAISFTFTDGEVASRQSNRTDRPDTRTGQTNQTDQTSYMKKIDREKNLSISQERVDLTWPKLAASGFGAHQIEQIQDALAELGKPADRIVQSLDHAEWELERGKMLDKDGRPVTDPCSWVFRSLARTGYYRRPAGYVSAEEQAIRDAEEEARAISQARQEADAAAFEAWRGGLSAQELSDAMKGHPGGPRDAWLRKVWRERAETEA